MWYNTDMSHCLHCRKTLETRWQKKYCSNRCQCDFQHALFIASWKNGTLAPSQLNTINISQYLKKYLFEKYGQKCSLCGWEEKHPISGLVPVEVDHIDGNSQNNKEANLRLICPNCHALTPNFKNRNRGSGRLKRRNSYIKKGKKNALNQSNL